jgi:thioredoxin 1
VVTYDAAASNREVDMSGSIATLTDATFDEVVGSADKPILVDFWAEWCGPCKMIAPILEELADEQSERFSIGKLDVDANVATATKFSVMSIPTLLLFKDGEVVARLVGAKPKGALLNEITASL